MKILLTGAGGFIGQYITNNLCEHTVHALRRQDLDVRDAALLRQHVRDNGYDWIINCATTGRDRVRDQDPMIFQDNILMFANLVALQDQVRGIINFGSGAEFDISRNITMAKEPDIWHSRPTHSYGLSKNVISRLSSASTSMHILRLFGCFDASETPDRPIKKLVHAAKNNEPFVIEQDRWFDWISAADLLQVVRHVLTETQNALDINLVYRDKTRLSDFFRLYCTQHGISTDCIEIRRSDGLDFTGQSARLDSLGIPLLGLETSLEHYRIP